MKRAIAILFLLPLLTTAVSQGTAKVTAWIDVQQIDGKVVVSCWCQNHTSSPLHLGYKAILLDNDSIVQEGKTLALPDQPNLLLNANFLVPDGQFERLQIFIFNKQELVAYSQAIGPKHETPIATQPLTLTTPSGEYIGLESLEIGSLVIDETRSKLAHDFYELFYNNWSSVEEDIKTNYTITIREQPTGIGIGTRIMVELDGNDLLQLNLQPRTEIVENLAIQLVESLYNKILHPEQDYQEIGTDDLSGSGIY